MNIELTIIIALFAFAIFCAMLVASLTSGWYVFQKKFPLTVKVSSPEKVYLFQSVSFYLPSVISFRIRVSIYKKGIVLSYPFGLLNKKPIFIPWGKIQSYKRTLSIGDSILLLLDSNYKIEILGRSAKHIESKLQ